MQHILHFITNERLAELHTALNRAANTWEDAPAWVIDLCDALHAGQVSAGLSVTLDESTALIGTLGAKAVRGEVPGGNLPDWPDDLTTYELRAAYQRGVADGRAGSFKAAEATLQRLGYTYNGGQLWKPPLGSFEAFASKCDELLGIKNAPRRGQWEQHPYQQEAMASLASVPTKITMAEEVDDIVDPSFDYLPEWAERKVAPGEDGYRCLHAQLMTRDGRRSGNAVIASFGADTEACNAVVLTDMGNEMVMNHTKLKNQFYPPVYVMKADCVGKRLAKSESEPNPTKTLYTVGYNAEGERVTWCVRSSEDPCKDQAVMNAALELVQAITLRNVPITPEVLYKYLVGVEYTAHPVDDPLDTSGGETNSKPTQGPFYASGKFVRGPARPSGSGFKEVVFELPDANKAVMTAGTLNEFFAALPAPLEDPLDMPLPCDITVGHGTHGRGTKLRTLLDRMKSLYDMSREVTEANFVIQEMREQIYGGQLLVSKVDGLTMSRDEFSAYVADIKQEYRLRSDRALRGIKS